MDRETVLLSGYARLPSGTVSSEMYKVMALVVIVEVETGTILKAECTLSTRLSERFIAELLVGKSLRSELAEMIVIINKSYQGSAKKTIITALRIISDKYLAYVSGKGRT